MSNDGSVDAMVSDIVANLRIFNARMLVHSLLASEALGLAPTDLVCMCLLQLEGPVSAGWLAEMTGLTTGAVTGVVNRLERAGYATRKPDPTDRRRVIVHPRLDRFARDIERRAANRSPNATGLLAQYTPAPLRVIKRFVADLALASTPGKSAEIES